MAISSSRLRQSFRSVEAQKKGDVVETLSRLRKSQPPSNFASLFGAFRTAAPKTFQSLCLLDSTSPSTLVWARKTLIPLSLESELVWAIQWLSPHSLRVNEFRLHVLQIQTLLTNGDVAGALALLDEHVHSRGWSLWAVELRAALLQLLGGTPMQREWLHILQSQATNSIPGLLFEIFGDRNDDTFSYDTIYAKCMSSFPRFGSLAPWLVDYLKYRALAHVENPSASIPNILCRDITSSLIDYYESVLEALLCIESDATLAALRPIARQLISALLSSGYKDQRLTKLLLAFDICQLPIARVVTRPEEPYRAMYLGSLMSGEGTLPANVAPALVKCQNEGAAAYDLAGTMLKWGVNLRGLDVGPAVAMAALQSISGLADYRILPANILILSASICVDDAAGLPTDRALRVLRAFLRDKGNNLSDDQLLKPSQWAIEKVLPQVGPLHLWLAMRLLEAGDYAELNGLIALLRDQSPYWLRQCAKLEILASLKTGRLDDSISELEAWCRKDHLYALEFPTDKPFAGRKWSDFKQLDPVTVGLVAHHEAIARNSANVAYICKMACRSFLVSGGRQGIVDDFNAGSSKRKEQLIAFIRDVWVEENLALCHQFNSTTDVRTERMVILQLLLEWDRQQAVEYAEAIKQLTFDQTLQRGLQHIDQTRVFVNESAITRWAEKELEQEYDRWKRLSESSTGGRVVDDILRQYVLDATNVEVLKEFAHGKPTAADAQLIDMLDRLFKRFLLDPVDGLDTYLSVRIRHGSLRGTILGPLEEQSLLYSATGFSEEAFEARWASVLRLSAAEREKLVDMLQDFSLDIRKAVDDFVEQRVQVRSADKPYGAFQQTLLPIYARIIAASLAERPPSFHAFLYNSYFAFWKFVDVGLQNLRAYVHDVLATALYGRIDDLMHGLRALGPKYLPLLTTLTTASTMTKSQCDTVAEWFQLPSMIGNEKYQLPAAIEIASVATRNVHRSFPAEIRILCLPATQLPLTVSGLSVLMDCLFVVFENSWKHSGLAGELPPIDLLAEFDENARLLTLNCRSTLSDERKNELLAGELTQLRDKYLGELPLELIRLEGGSGFPKLARLARTVSREICPHPFDFGIQGDQWFTRLTVPLYEREGAFEAYE